LTVPGGTAHPVWLQTRSCHRHQVQQWLWAMQQHDHEKGREYKAVQSKAVQDKVSVYAGAVGMQRGSGPPTTAQMHLRPSHVFLQARSTTCHSTESQLYGQRPSLYKSMLLVYRSRIQPLAKLPRRHA
jgi:hypothetical protein